MRLLACNGPAMTSHALLLRLFLSPTFFSLHVALKYLLIYADNIGITYYLTRRLRELSVHELYDVWGFIWSLHPLSYTSHSLIAVTIATSL